MTLQDLHAALMDAGQRRRRKQALDAELEAAKAAQKERSGAFSAANQAVEQIAYDLDDLERTSLLSVMSWLQGDKEARITELRTSLQAETQTCDQARAALTELKAKIEALEAEIAGLGDDPEGEWKAALEAKAEALAAEPGPARDQLAAMAAENTEIEAELAKLDNAGDAVFRALSRTDGILSAIQIARERERRNPDNRNMSVGAQHALEAARTLSDGAAEATREAAAALSVVMDERVGFTAINSNQVIAIDGMSNLARMLGQSQDFESQVKALQGQLRAARDYVGELRPILIAQQQDVASRRVTLLEMAP